jgi:chromosome segregation ATPase
MSDHNAEQVALDSVSSLAADAFSRLTQLQEELRRRLQAVSVREGTLDALAHNLETRSNELKAFAAQLETRAKELDEKEAAAVERVTRREDVVSAFQEMLAHMHTSLNEMSSESIMTALDAGAAYEERATQAKTEAVTTKGARNGGEAPARPAIGLTPQEQKAFFALRESGQSDAEILAGIYAARQQATGAPA